MVTITHIFLIGTIFATFVLTQAEDSKKANDVTIFPRERRYVDQNFQRRYNHLRREYAGNPLMFDFFKYFLRNRGQREKRQIDYGFPSNSGFGNGYGTYNQPRPRPRPVVRPTSVQQKAKAQKRETQRKPKPFRPQAAIFF